MGKSKSVSVRLSAVDLERIAEIRSLRGAHNYFVPSVTDVIQAALLSFHNEVVPLAPGDRVEIEAGTHWDANLNAMIHSHSVAVVLMVDGDHVVVRSDEYGQFDVDRAGVRKLMPSEVARG